jgi:hypothetical protein
MEVARWAVTLWLVLDPRIYRTGLVAAALAVIVVAFSLGDQQGPTTTAIPPDAFNGQNAYTNMVGLAAQYPSRRPGSYNDDTLATRVRVALAHDGFNVSTDVHTGHTADGNRALETVTGVRAGLQSGSIVIVAHRDSLGSPSIADLSGTAVLLELARVLSGETQHRSIVLVSTSGSAGLAGATHVATALGGPIDAMITLGNLAGSRVHEPIVVPWSNGRDEAPTMLRNTLAATLAGQAGLRPGGTSIGGQLAHLAFPLTTSEQGPFGTVGEPAVLLSLSGDNAPAADEPIAGADQITNLGRMMLQTINALDTGPSVPPPSAYMLIDGKVVPAWAVRLLVLTLILPVLRATIDGMARARRRGNPIIRWVLWVLSASLPFLISLGVILGAEKTGALLAPPGPVHGGVVPLSSAGAAVLVVVAVVIVVSFLARGPLIRVFTRGHRLGSPGNPGAAAAALLVMCAVAVAIWAGNPFAALLLMPALHLWMWILDPDRAIPRLLKAVMLLVGIAPVALVVLHYAHTLGLGPLGVAWEAVLLVAGGHIPVAVAIEWSIVLGCLASVIAIVVRTPRVQRREEHVPPAKVRGPISYAGPGSLGGTKSAIRQ